MVKARVKDGRESIINGVGMVVGCVMVWARFMSGLGVLGGLDWGGIWIKGIIITLGPVWFV